MSCAALRSIAFIAGLAVAGLITIAPASAQSTDVGDPAKGYAFARLNCSTCHAIQRGRARSRVEEATPFQVFANTPGVTRTAMLVFLRTPHPTMPNLVVTGEDADNVIAYILSLQRAR